MTKLLQWGFPASFVWSCYVKLLQWGFRASFVWSCYVAYLLVGDQCSASGILPASGLPARELDYISTRLARCLDKQPWLVWSLVFCIEFQVLMLLEVWSRLMSQHASIAQFHWFQFHWFQPLMIALGLTFIISLAMVVEFRNDRHESTKLISMSEAEFHALSAVVTFLSLGFLHAVFAISLLILNSQPVKNTSPRSKVVPSIDWRYEPVPDGELPKQEAWLCEGLLDVLYFVCVIVFLITWTLSTSSNSSNGAVYRTSVYSEWVGLGLGVAMHLYAYWCGNTLCERADMQHRPASTLERAWSTLRGASCAQLSWKILLRCTVYVFFFIWTLLTVVLFAPLQVPGSEKAQEHVHSTVVLLLVVLSAYACATCLLLAA